MNGRWIVVTSIHRPTAALRRVGELCQQDGWAAVVVADAQTPTDWSCPGVEFLSLAEQHERYGPLAEAIPTRHYSRKNLGYLHAMARGARLIVDLDDDNLPLAGFGRDLRVTVGSGRALASDGWANVYPHFGPSGAAPIWPRGLPLDAIHSPGVIGPLRETARCPVQQYLADGDPDVDAIHRLTTPGQVRFDPGAAPVVLQPGCWSPFNSQNTVFFEEAFPLLYLPSFVSFRMTDIWRSLVAQAALWASGGRVSFHAPTVRQQRNPHDLMRDFEEELPGHLHNRRIATALSEVAGRTRAGLGLGACVVASWKALVDIGVVQEREMALLEAWLSRVPSPSGRGLG